MPDVKFVTMAFITWTAAAVFAAAPAPGQRGGAPVAAPGTGESIFVANCAFCHGRDATGGASGPDLTDSALVGQDVNGDKIIPVVHNGRPEKGMPPFAALPDADVKKIVEYIHKRKTDEDANPGRRRKVSAEDVSSGNADAGRGYFDANCKSCHSATGDLNGVASKYRGLALMQRMLYPTAQNAAAPPGAPRPKPAPVTATVTLPGGDTVAGALAYRDEFNIAITDAAGRYRSWPTAGLKIAVKDPLQGHADLLGKYTDADIHNLFAYLQTLK
jgi:cytochrome c oxidase cbb3-type subunit 3